MNQLERQEATDQLIILFANAPLMTLNIIQVKQLDKKLGDAIDKDDRQIYKNLVEWDILMKHQMYGGTFTLLIKQDN